MQSPASRQDSSHDLRYPDAPDGRGSTRVHHLRRPYYLGPFESAQSYIMFGLWKHYITEEGQPLGSNQLRTMVDELLEKSPPPEQKKSRLFPAVSVGLLCCSILGAAGILSTRETTKVDGISMSVDERDFIRSVRKLQLSNDKAKLERIAHRVVKLMEEGPEHAQHQRNRPKF